MNKQKIRQAYRTLSKAVEDKPIDKRKTPKEQIIQVDDTAHYIRNLQDIAVYLDVIK